MKPSNAEAPPFPEPESQDMPPRRRRLGGKALSWLIVSGVVLILVFLVTLKMKSLRTPPLETDIAPTPVGTMTVQGRRISDVITLPGRIEPFIDADLASEQAGRIVEITVAKGDRVRPGQVLLKVDDRIWKETARKAEIALREAARDLKRWQELRKNGAVSASEFDDMKLKHDFAESALTDAKVKRAQCEIRSPMAGVIDDRYLDPGEYIHEGERAFKVVNIDTVKVLVDIPERDIGLITPGMRISFEAAALPERTFPGTVSFVAASAGRHNNSFRTEIVSDNPDHSLKGGMIARVSVVSAVREHAIVLPLSAVIPTKGNHVVFLVKDGHAVRRTVKIDSITDEDVILASGVEDGESLVIEGHRNLDDGVAVTVATTVSGTTATQPDEHRGRNTEE
ncbi:efflux RND transporter periplasmic adaptor subunit [Verrucomicrobiota bacterium]